MLAFAGVLSVVLAALYFTLDADAPGYRRARAVLNLTCYAIALLLFLLIPSSWSEVGRSLTLGGVAALLALELLRGTEGRPRLSRCTRWWWASWSPRWRGLCS